LQYWIEFHRKLSISRIDVHFTVVVMTVREIAQ